AAIEWMRAVGRAIDRGFAITIDYGHPAEELYGPHRPRGTLFAYTGHRTSEAFYDRIGRQDLTAHVDFTTLARAGREAGLEPAGFTDQTSFLLGLGAAQAADAHLAAIDNDAERDREVRAIAALLDPQGMGRTFKVLIQRKGLPPHPLRGLSVSSMAHLLEGHGH
ncbi:MAG: SAM-dependent methyltransferase, partial [Nitrospiria bacterium]